MKMEKGGAPMEQKTGTLAVARRLAVARFIIAWRHALHVVRGFNLA